MPKPTLLRVEGAGLPNDPVTKVQILPDWDEATAEAYARKVFPNAIITSITIERPEGADAKLP